MANSKTPGTALQLSADGRRTMDQHSHTAISHPFLLVLSTSTTTTIAGNIAITHHGLPHQSSGKLRSEPMDSSPLPPLLLDSLAPPQAPRGLAMGLAKSEQKSMRTSWVWSCMKRPQTTAPSVRADLSTALSPHRAGSPSQTDGGAKRMAPQRIQYRASIQLKHAQEEKSEGRSEVFKPREVSQWALFGGLDREHCPTETVHQFRPRSRVPRGPVEAAKPKTRRTHRSWCLGVNQLQSLQSVKMIWGGPCF